MGKILNFIVGLVIGAISGAAGSLKCFEKKIIKSEKESYRFRVYYELTRKWVEAYQLDKSLEEHLLEKGYKTVAIYGMGDVGYLLFRELESSKIKVEYGIDKNTIGRGFNLKIVAPSNNMEEVDAIIVTAVFAFDDIKAMLEPMVNCPIVALDDLIYELC